MSLGLMIDDWIRTEFPLVRIRSSSDMHSLDSLATGIMLSSYPDATLPACEVAEVNVVEGSIEIKILFPDVFTHRNGPTEINEDGSVTLDGFIKINDILVTLYCLVDYSQTTPFLIYQRHTPPTIVV